MSCAGESEWSQIEELYGTKASDWEDVPVPEVAEGDQIDPCPVILGTPVLSNTKTLHHGMVRLDWQDIEDAGWHVVQYYHVKSGEWLDLPAAGVDIVFHGSSAVVSNLHGLSWLRVRAMSCAGESEWSQIEELYGTKASEWEDVPVPEVAEGDEIEPCSENADTPDNSPATGDPTISGTAQVGETLTANTSGIADADGLENATFTYQWQADDADISGATGSTYTLSDTDEGKVIKVRVSFTDDAGNEGTLTSAPTDAVAAASLMEPLAKPTGLEATATHDSVTLTWDDPDDESITGYEILRGDGQTEPTTLVAATGSAVAIYADNTATQASEIYTYLVRALRGDEKSEASDEAVVQLPPEALRSVVSGVSHDSVLLAWSSPQDDTVTGYRILRADSVDGVSGQFATIVADTGSVEASYADDGVGPERDYLYRVLVISAHGVSSPSPDVSVSTPAAPAAEPPVYPTGSPAGPNVAATHDTVTLTWDESDDETIAGNVVLRGSRDDDPSGRFDDVVAALPVSATMYTDGTVKANTDYTYRIKAVNRHGGSGPSLWFHVKTLEVPVPGQPMGLTAMAIHDFIFLAWDDPQDDSITGYVVRRCDEVSDPVGTCDPINSDTGSATPTYVDFAVELERQYVYQIQAINADGFSEISQSVIGDTPATPGPMPVPMVNHGMRPHSVGAVAGHDRVVVTWDAPEGAGSRVFNYRILRHRPGEGQPEPLVHVEYTWSTSTQYVDTDVTAGTLYVYQVQAADFYGFWGPASESASARVRGVVNNWPRGLPAIRGFPRVGETLTVDMSRVADADGLSTAVFKHQWLRHDLDIDGATEASYVVSEDDWAYALKVRVRFTDDAGNEQYVTSRATTDVVAGANGGSSEEAMGVQAEIVLENNPVHEGETAGVDVSMTGFTVGKTYRVSVDVVEITSEHFVAPADICEGRDLGHGAHGLTFDSSDAVYSRQGYVSKRCPVGDYQILVKWEAVDGGDKGSRSTRFQVVENPSGYVTIQESATQYVDYIQPEYPDPPAEHTPYFIMSLDSGWLGNIKQVYLGFGGLMPDDDIDTLDYVVSIRVLDGDSNPLEDCTEYGAGGSYLVYTIPDGGGWGRQVSLSQQCMRGGNDGTLTMELLNGSLEFLGRHERPLRGRP